MSEGTIDRPVVWVAEAWRDGERLKRVVHVTKKGASRDITQMTSFMDPDHVFIHPEPLYLGDKDEFHLTKDDIDE